MMEVKVLTGSFQSKSSHRSKTFNQRSADVAFQHKSHLKSYQNTNYIMLCFNDYFEMEALEALHGESFDRKTKEMNENWEILYRRSQNSFLMEIFLIKLTNY